MRNTTPGTKKKKLDFVSQVRWAEGKVLQTKSETKEFLCFLYLERRLFYSQSDFCILTIRRDINAKSRFLG
jgi:hypothetical protein